MTSQSPEGNGGKNFEHFLREDAEKKGENLFTLNFASDSEAVAAFNQLCIVFGVCRDPMLDSEGRPQNYVAIPLGKEEDKKQDSPDHILRMERTKNCWQIFITEGSWSSKPEAQAIIARYRAKK